MQNLCPQAGGITGNRVYHIYIAQIYCTGIGTRSARYLDKPTSYHPNNYHSQQANEDYTPSLFNIAYYPSAKAAPASQLSGPILPHLSNYLPQPTNVSQSYAVLLGFRHKGSPILFIPVLFVSADFNCLAPLTPTGLHSISIASLHNTLLPQSPSAILYIDKEYGKEHEGTYKENDLVCSRYMDAATWMRQYKCTIMYYFLR